MVIRAVVFKKLQQVYFPIVRAMCLSSLQTAECKLHPGLLFGLRWVALVWVQENLSWLKYKYKWHSLFSRTPFNEGQCEISGCNQNVKSNTPDGTKSSLIQTFSMQAGLQKRWRWSGWRVCVTVCDRISKGDERIMSWRRRCWGGGGAGWCL